MWTLRPVARVWDLSSTMDYVLIIGLGSGVDRKFYKGGETLKFSDKSRFSTDFPTIFRQNPLIFLHRGVSRPLTPSIYVTAPIKNP